MSKNLTELPFTEIVERASELSRERAEVEKKIRGIVNDVYTREIPRKEDWTFLVVTSALTTTQEYKTGTVSVNTGATQAVFSTDATLTADMTGRKLKVQNNDYVYDVTYESGTSVTIQPPFSGTQNQTNVSYSIFDPDYPLAADFDRFLKDKGLTKYQGGRKQEIPEKSPQEFDVDYTPTTAIYPSRCRLIGTDTNGRTLVEINPPPSSAVSLQYDYYRRPNPLRETTAGFVNIGAGATAVTGSTGTTRFSEARTGDYIRIDALGTGADSEWYRVQTIAHDSSITLSSAFGLSGVTSAAYTICSLPDYPVKLHPAILYGTLIQLTLDQNDPASQGYYTKFAEVLSDGKRLYKTRVYSQQINTVAEDYNYRR